MNTAENYRQRALDYLTGKGLASGKFPVIRRYRDGLAWQEWIAYFEYIGLKHSAAMMTESATSWTVPAISPQEFDPDRAAIAIERIAERRRANKDLSNEERAAIVAKHQPAEPPAKPKPPPEDWFEFRDRMRAEIREVARDRAGMNDVPREEDWRPFATEGSYDAEDA